LTEKDLAVGEIKLAEEVERYRLIDEFIGLSRKKCMQKKNP
jgi:hypothetical protein